MTNLLTLTSAQLKRAIQLKDQIARLENKLANILGSPASSMPTRKKFKMSAKARAKIAAAQKARWAKVADDRDLKEESRKNKKIRLQKPKRKMSAAARARISASAKARWAKAKAAGKTRL